MDQVPATSYKCKTLLTALSMQLPLTIIPVGSEKISEVGKKLKKMSNQITGVKS